MGAIQEAGLRLNLPKLPPRGGAKWTAERVLSVHQWTPTLLSIRLTRYKGFRFTPGHYARLGLAGEGGETVWRPFSVVSAAYDEHLEFLAVLVPGGAFSGRLEKLAVGDSVQDFRVPAHAEEVRNALLERLSRIGGPEQGPLGEIAVRGVDIGARTGNVRLGDVDVR